MALTRLSATKSRGLSIFEKIKLSRILLAITIQYNYFVRLYFVNRSGDIDLPGGDGGFGASLDGLQHRSESAMLM